MKIEIDDVIDILEQRARMELAIPSNDPSQPAHRASALRLIAKRFRELEEQARDNVDPGRSAKYLSVTAPLVEFRFTTHTTTGKNPETRPGVGITYIQHTEAALPWSELQGPDGPCREMPGGVIDRTQIRKLRDLLTDFLVDFPRISDEDQDEQTAVSE